MFHTPNDNTIIWRYIDFTKFIDLLENESLFFCRSDKFQDPYEGFFRLKDYEKTRNLLGNQNLVKKFYFINCWHRNDNQSDAMWRIFLKTNNGIAIKSSVARFKKALNKSPEDIFLSEVYYRDFEKVTFKDLMSEEQNQWPVSGSNIRGATLNQFSYKRISFEHEKEIRAFYLDTPIPAKIKGGTHIEFLDSKTIKIELSQLIDEIVIAPFADSWLAPLVEKILLRYKLNIKVTSSKLYDFENDEINVSHEKA